MIDVMQIPGRWTRARARIVSGRERGGDRKRLSGGKYRDKMNGNIVSMREIFERLEHGGIFFFFFKFSPCSMKLSIFLCSKFFERLL